MSACMITVLVNEQSRSVPVGLTVEKLRDRIKLGADVMVVNGLPCRADIRLKERFRMVLIRRGEIPRQDELEKLMVVRHTPSVHERMKKPTVGSADLGHFRLGSSKGITIWPRTDPIVVDVLGLKNSRYRKVRSVCGP
jgi:sulfur carrier protein ThiS adenylyltransferase